MVCGRTAGVGVPVSASSIDQSLHLVRSATECLIRAESPATKDLRAARRALEVQELLEAAGATGTVEALQENCSANEMLREALDRLDEVPPAERHPRLPAARAELALLVHDLDRPA